MKRNTMIAALVALGVGIAGIAAKNAPFVNLFARDNLVAWCIVPFDSKHRGPEERAQMLKRLGITKLAYDWRDKDIPAFDQEIDALAKHGIRLEAFWLPYPVDSSKPNRTQLILDVLKRRNVKTQLWFMLAPPKSFDALPQEEKLKTAAEAVAKVAVPAKAIGCTVALYNHGGWFGQPENQVQIIRRLHMDNIGIVYNLHHGHEQLARFPQLLMLMLPHMMAININGMRAEGPMV
ncbi:MAG: xylose isomerase, partial [Bryobacteraceae bacterium]